MAIEPLRDFQAEDIPWFITHKRSMILYDPRLGKTVVSCNILAQDQDVKKVLVVCPKNALFVWRDHIYEWFAHLCPNRSVSVRVIKGKGGTAAEQRKALWLLPSNTDVTFYITTFGSLDRDYKLLQLPSTIKSGIVFDTVLGDEVHTRLRNRKNKAVAYFKWFTRPNVCKRFHALSGTLASKGGPADFWAILNMINPGLFSSFWRFAGQFLEVIDNGYGKEIIGPKNLENFHKFVLDAYSRRRFRDICAPQMPKVQRRLIKVEPTDEQQRIWNDLGSEGFSWVGDNLLVSSTSLETVLRKRQLMTCPKLLNADLGFGAAIEDVVERMTDVEQYPEQSTHIVIFSAFRQALPYFEQYLRNNGFKNVWQLYGGMEPEEQAENIRRFKETKGIILCSTKYAMAFSLIPSTQCFHIGYEWDPNDNKQAEDRLVPQTGHTPIDSGYYSYLGMDEGIAHSVNIKNELITLTLGSAKSFQSR